MIYGERGQRQCVLNGAAARTCQEGDQVIICASDYLEADAVTRIEPKVLTCTADNHIAEILTYKAHRDEQGRMSFEILKGDKAMPIPYRAETF